MTIGDLVSYLVIVMSLITLLTAWRNARQLTNGPRRLLLAVCGVMAGSILIYSLIEAGFVTVQAMIDVPVLRTIVLCTTILIWGLVVYVSRSRP